MVEDHHGAMFDGQALEPALKLVAIDDRAQALRSNRFVNRQEAKVGWPVPLPATFGVAGAHEEPVRPGVKTRRIAKLGEVSPDGQQRLLRRVLGEMDVAQDPVSHRVKPATGSEGEAREGLFIAVLGCGLLYAWRKGALEWA